MSRSNAPSEGFSTKNRTLLTVLAFLGIMGYGDVAGNVNAQFETSARTDAEGALQGSRDDLHLALGKRSLKNNPGVNWAECNTVATFELDGRECEVGVDANGMHFIFVEGVAYFIGDEEKAEDVISTLKNLFGTRNDAETILASK